MKYLKIVGLSLTLILTMGMALAGDAFAAEEGTEERWGVCVEGKEGVPPTKYTTNECTTAANENKGKWEDSTATGQSDTVRLSGFTLRLTDFEAKPLNENSTIVCSGKEIEGWSLVTLGTGKAVINAFRVKNPKVNCERKSGPCKAGTVSLAEGADLPWKLRLFREPNNKILSKIEATTNGEPGWEIECETLEGVKSDTCVSGGAAKLEKLEFSNQVTSNVLLVLAEYGKRNRLNCSRGAKVETGEVEGSFAMLLWSGNGLSIF